MASSSNTGCGALVAVAVTAFFVGRASVSEKATTPVSPATSAQQFMDTPVSAPLPTPSVQPIYTAPEPQPERDRSVYFQNCDAARAAGAAPVREGDPGYAPHLDRDSDGIGCE